jgi:hypothetical protein
LSRAVSRAAVPKYSRGGASAENGMLAPALAEDLARLVGRA